MSINARVIAIGPFSTKIQDYLDFPPNFYNKTKEGSQIVTTVFTAPFTNSSAQLSEYVGVLLWQFEQHQFDPYKVDLKAMEKSDFIHPEELECFLALREAGFIFFFSP